MHFSPLRLLAALALASTALAQTYVEFNSGYYDATNPNVPQQVCTASQTNAACAADARTRKGVGYSVLTTVGGTTTFTTCPKADTATNTPAGYCKIFLAYPARCGGILASTNRTTAWIQRCSPQNGTNYYMYGDATCVPARAQPPTQAEYSAQCSGAFQPTVSSKAYRKRSPVEIALPVDEKSADGRPIFNHRICQHLGPGYKACGVESNLKDNAYRCVDVSSNLESCGGCPRRGGVDCSDLDGVDSVSCRSGSCYADSCLRGWYNLAGTCVSLKPSSKR